MSVRVQTTMIQCFNSDYGAYRMTDISWTIILAPYPPFQFNAAHLRITDLQTSCGDFIKWQGISLVIPSNGHQGTYIITQFSSSP